MTQHGQRVVAQDRVVARDPRQDRLGAAREAGELVLLDLSQGDAQIGLPDPPVEEHLVAAARRADAHQVARPGIVVDDTQPRGPLTQMLCPLVGVHRPVRADADHHRDVLLAHAGGGELGDDRGEEVRGWGPHAWRRW